MKRYNLSHNFFQRNLSVFLQTGTTNPSHRPSDIHPSDGIYVLQQIARRREAGNEASKPEIYAMFREAKIQRTEDINSDRFDSQAPKSKPTYKDYSVKCMDKFIEMYCIKKSVNDTAYTCAREKATGDPFLSYAWYLVNAAFSSYLTDVSK